MQAAALKPPGGSGPDRVVQPGRALIAHLGKHFPGEPEALDGRRHPTVNGYLETHFLNLVRR